MSTLSSGAGASLADARLLARLDDFDLLLIEQPLGEDDLREHAELARLIRTPVCLDESIVSAKVAADAIALRATRVVNVKPGRVGGYLEARRVHDVCRANGIPVCRYYAHDVTEPFVLDDGHLAVPTGPGLGVDPLPDALAAVTTATEWLTA